MEVRHASKVRVVVGTSSCAHVMTDPPQPAPSSLQPLHHPSQAPGIGNRHAAVWSVLHGAVLSLLVPGKLGFTYVQASSQVQCSMSAGGAVGGRESRMVRVRGCVVGGAT